MASKGSAAVSQPEAEAAHLEQLFTRLDAAAKAKQYKSALKLVEESKHACCSWLHKF